MSKMSDLHIEKQERERAEYIESQTPDQSDSSYYAGIRLRLIWKKRALKAEARVAELDARVDELEDELAAAQM